MKKYIIKEIYADGYERFAVITGINSDNQFTVHFMEYDEYIENGRVPRKRKAGDALQGELFIDLVTIDKKMDKELLHRQAIQNSSHIEAVVQVDQVKDDFCLYAFSSIIDDKILVEFEHEVDCRPGDRVYIEGSLEMSLVEYS